MTDKEIIKALECCKKLTHNGWSKNQKICEEECPYKANCYDEEKNINMISEVLDLINRQQAEIERLQQETKNTNDLRLEIFENKSAFERIARIKAIKEFAERLKKEIYTNIKNNTMTKSQYIAENYKCLSCDFIATSRGKNEGLKTAFKLVNNLVKEMVGEQE